MKTTQKLLILHGGLTELKFGTHNACLCCLPLKLSEIAQLVEHFAV